MKKYTNSKKIRILLISTVLLIIIISTTYALSFTQNPLINSGNDASTIENLTCSWTQSGDTTNATVYWYNGSTLFSTETSAISPSILLYQNTKKSETWTCNVTIENLTNNINLSDSISIINTLPEAPTLYSINNVDMGSTLTLTEDQIYVFDLNSSDVDGDTFTFSQDATDGFCGILSSFNLNTGSFNCTPTNDDLTDPDTQQFKQVVFFAKDGSPGQGQNLVVDIFVNPFNDQAEFDIVPGNISINADQVWSYSISGTDEESHTPLNFSITSSLGILQVINTSDTTAEINITTGSATNDYVGNWTVILNITDSYGHNTTRQATQYQFTLEILRTNHDPNITSYPELTASANQSELYTNYIYGNDSDEINNLTWNITYPLNASIYCMNNFPWDITTINNSPINSSGLINETITNDHVACRYVKIILQDDEDGITYKLVTLNITNENDPPTINPISENGNISNQIVHRYSIKEYQVNVTDPDSLTYDALNTANLTYSINETSFLTINNETGLITMSPTENSHIGNWSINISVTNGEFLDWALMNISVINNTPPELIINQTEFNFNQNDLIEIEFNVLENNNESINITVTTHTSFNSSYYQISTTYNNYSNNINNQTNLLNMTKNNTYLANKQVGLHNITIVSKDELNSSRENVSTETISIIINNENDAPIFDQDRDNFSDTLNMGVVVQNIEVNKTVYITDYDLYLSSEWANETTNLIIQNSSSGLNLLTVNKINNSNSQYALTFTPTIQGDAWIVLNISDASNTSTVQNVSFTILQASQPPEIQLIKPYQNQSQNITVQFLNITNFPSNRETLSFYENLTLDFDAIITNDTSIPNNNLTYEWYYDGELQLTIENVTPGTNSNFTKEFDFWSNGTHNVSLIATDSRLSSTNFFWSLDITNLNRYPQYFANSLEDIDVNYSSEFVDYMSYRNLVQRFYDPDDDLDADGMRSLEYENESTELTYSLVNPGACSLATFSFSEDTLRVNPIATGICVVQFLATDAEGETELSDEITVTVIGATPNAGQGTGSSSGGSRTNTRVITVPIDVEVETPKPIKIIAPLSVDTYENRTIHIPITIKNTWEEEIRGITINATLALQENVTYSFDRSYYSRIPAGGEETSIISISNYRTDGPFEITIFAAVQEPPFIDSTTILINSLEQTDEGKEITAKVTFARDMLSENPECRELTELLDRAERALNDLNYKESLDLVTGVINGCKFLMNEENIIKRETPGFIEKSFELLDEHADKLVIGSGILLILTIAFYVIAAFKKLITDDSKK
ncbi:hypothetical protein K9L67_00755 [Candidatus Woesearchaeota archaeon]|nr:hypothetical protein [Candidatus Woesearchaeota archaeon]MCF7900736.1 hypothetical protein [Candidatus Woesearchaeota archaeon]MCF8012901.1 hypothetical protein [Candidatus Woesearchaeota archaeon]